MSGKSRWGNYPVVALADSKEGKKLIDDGMRFTKEGFIEKIKMIKKLINFYNDDELFEEEIIDIKKKMLKELEDKKDKIGLGISWFKYYCSCVGEYSGTNIYLYDDDGSGIRNNKHLKDVLNKWGKENDKKVFVIPVDVHS